MSRATPGEAGEVPPIDPRDRRRQLAAALAFALVLGTVYQTMVLTDLVGDVIRKEVEADPYQMLWTSIASTNALFVGLIVGGHLAGRFGTRWVLVVGLLVFALGNLLLGSADSLAFLVAAQLVEGFGKGLATMAGRTTLYLQFDRRLLLAIGFYGVVAYATRFTSPAVAAVVNDQLSWRWVYWINVPLALGALAAVLATFRPNPPAEPKPVRIPWASLALLVAWLTGLSLALGWYRRWQGWTSDEFVLAATVAAVMPFVLLAKLLTGPHPNGHLRRFLGSAVMVLSMLTRMLMLVYLATVPAILATYMTEARGYPRPLAGAILVPGGLAMGLATALTTRFHRRSWRHAWLMVGVVGSSACLWNLAAVDNFTAREVIAARLAAWAFFLGLFPPAFLTDEVEGRNPRDAAFATALSLMGLMLSLSLFPSVTKIAIQAWSASAQDAMRQNIRPNRPAVVATAARVQDYYLRKGLPAGDAEANTKRLIGEYVRRESVAQGLQHGLRLLSLMMLAVGLIITGLLAVAARGLRAPPDSGYE